MDDIERQCAKINIEGLRKAIDAAMNEVQEADKLLKMAETESKRVNSIPKGKAGGGKGAKVAASKELREAKKTKQEKLNELEVAQKRLAGLSQTSEDGTCNVMGDSGGAEGSSVEKRERDEGPDGSVGAKKKQRVNQSDNEPTDGGLKGGQSTGSPFPSEAAVTNLSPGVSLESGEPEGPGNTMGDEMHLVAAKSVDGDSLKSLSESESEAAAIAGLNPSFMADVMDEDSSDTTGVGDPLKVRVKTDSVSFVALDKSGDEDTEAGGSGKTGQNAPIPTSDQDSESGISEFSETDTDEDEDKNLSLYPSDTDEGSSDADRRAYADKYTKNPELRAEEEQKMYRFLKESDQKNWVAKGRSAIKAFLAEGKPIDPGIRRMARTDPTYLPEAAATSQKLAIHFLTTNDGNIQCGYHAFKNKSTFVRDGWGKKGMQIKGVPGKKKLSSGKKKSDGKKAGLLLRPAKDLGNCGCRIEDILLEFILSKRLKIRGMVDGSKVEEMMMGTQDYQEPRDRSFTFEAIRGLAPCFSLNDFFKHDNSQATKEIKIAKKQVIYSLGVLNSKYRIHAMDEFVFKTLTLIPEDRLRELQANEKKLHDLERLAGTKT